MADVGDIVVRVGVNATQLVSGLASASGSVDNFSKSVGPKLASVAKSVAAVGTAAVAAGAGMVAGLYTKGSTVIDSQAKLARTVGSTVASVQALHRASDLAGISQEAMGNAAANLNAKVGEAMRGAGEAASVFEKLGLNAQALGNMEADERLAAVSDRMVQLGFNSSQAADTLRRLGVEERKMVGLMLDGGDAFRSARDDVEKFGIAVSDIEAAQIEAANDAMTSISATMQGVANTVAVELSPFIQEIGERFGQASAESGGFKSTIQSVIEYALRGFGKFSDVLQGLRVVFKGLEVAAQGFGALVLKVADTSWSAVAKLVDGATGKINFLIEGLNKIPGVDIAKIDPFSDSAFIRGLQGMSDAAIDKLREMNGELHALAMQQMPSEGIEQFLGEVEKRAQETAQKVVEARKRTGGDEASPLGLTDQDRAAMESKLEAIRQSTLTEQEILREKIESDREILAAALENKLLDEETYLQRLNDINATYQAEHTAIEKKAAKDREDVAAEEAKAKMDAMSAAFSNMSTLMNSESRKMFEVGKAAAIANTLVNAYTAIAGAYKVGSSIGGPVLGAAYGAAAGLAQFQTLQSIRNQQFGSGGGAAGSVTQQANSGSVPAVAGPQQAESTRTMRIEGFSANSLYQGSQLQAMAGALEEFWGDGGGKGRVIFA